MRSFFCLAYETPEQPAAELTILAADEAAARLLARQAIERHNLWRVEIREKGRLVASEVAGP
jgi:hypothetical protein